MRTYLLNPTLKDQEQFIREGRCMQKASSWAAVWPPITLALLGTMAKAVGEARVFDGNVEPKTLAELLTDLKAFAPDVVVVNTGFPSIDADMETARRIKEACPQVSLVSFGVYFTMLEKESAANYPFVDYILVGEPEATFGDLLRALAGKTKDLAAIPGLIFHRNGEIVQTPPRALIDTLDDLPIPDRTLLKNDRYRLPTNNQVFTLVNSARGCPHECIFCIVDCYYGHKIRKHSVDYVIREILACQKDFGINEFLFWEEAFTLDKKYVLALCEAIAARGLKIRWAATTRVASVDPDILAAMKRAGCYLLGLGVESGSQEILDRAHKKQTLADIRRAVALCRQAGISTMGHFIFGLPGETRATAEETIRFMLGLGLDFMQCYCAVPYPKTALGAQAKAASWIQAERWSQYDFGGASIMRTDTLTPAEVDYFRRKAFFRFYFRPGYILKKIFTDLSVWQLFRLSMFTDWMNLVGAGARKRAAK